MKEKLTNKGLSAMIIDLAVRGYVKIKEDKKSKFEIVICSIIKNITKNKETKS